MLLKGLVRYVGVFIMIFILELKVWLLYFWIVIKVVIFSGLIGYFCLNLCVLFFVVVLRVCGCVRLNLIWLLVKSFVLNILVFFL